VDADPGYNPILTLELEYYCKDGATAWAENKFSVIRDPGGKFLSILGESRNITERKRAEEALRESEERFRNMANLLPQTVFETDEKGNFTFVNRQGFEMFGYSQADIIEGMNVLETIIPEDRDRAVINISQRIKGEEFPSQEYTAIRKDGSKFPVSVYAAPIVLNSEYVGLRGMLIDISERIKTEEAIRASERRFKSIFEHVSDLCQSTGRAGAGLYGGGCAEQAAVLHYR
jgi:PAS domain S-box-containing protein